MIRLSAPTRPLQGRIILPSDKSIAHRRILLAGCIEQPTELILTRPGKDILSSLSALQSLGIEIEQKRIDSETTSFAIHGRENWSSPTNPIDCGNSGTTCRLLLGLLAGKQIKATLTGDKSLRTRPMERIATPLRQMGASLQTTGGKLPIEITPSPLHGITYRLPIASAQLKSALLFAGLFADGETEIIEPTPTRDHTERLLQLTPSISASELRWKVSCNTLISIPQGTIPGDPSSASYFITLALSLPNSSLELENVALNATRIDYLSRLIAQSASIQIQPFGINGGEPVGTIVAKSCTKSFSFDLHASDVPLLIDEIPTLAVFSAVTGGSFHLDGAAELRVKECDRISALVNGLSAMGVPVEESNDGFAFDKPGKLTGADIYCRYDHRIAMSFAIAALHVSSETTLHNAKIAVDISFPGFFTELKRIVGLHR